MKNEPYSRERWKRGLVAACVAGGAVIVCLVATADFSSRYSVGFDMLGVVAFGGFPIGGVLLVRRSRRTWMIAAGLVLLAYLGSYVAVSSVGGYYFSQSGRIRYSFGMSVSDVSIWHPAGVWWEPYVDVRGSETSRGTTLGYFYSPLIRLDRRYVHPTEELFDEWTMSRVVAAPIPSGLANTPWCWRRIRGSLSQHSILSVG